MLLNPIKQKLEKIIRDSYEKSFGKKLLTDFLIEKTKEEKFGDYAANLAMVLSKELKLNPREIAEKIIQNLPEESFILKAEIAGPGFINFFLKDLCFVEIFKFILDEKTFLKPDLGEKKKVVIEYSQPNIAKPLGVHHILSTVIGQAISNIYEYLNYDVIRVNYIGDYGTQFGKLIYAYKTWGNKEQVEKDPITELLKLYVKFHEEAEKDKTIEDYGRSEFKKLEGKDAENMKLWQWIREVSLSEIKATYQRLGGITFEDKDYVGESFYNDKMDEILEDGKRKGIFKLSEGAYISEFDDMPPLLVQKSDGTTLYATRDLAQIKYRTNLGIIKNMMVVDTAQSLHFRQCFATAKKLGLNINSKTKEEVALVHTVFGRMQLPDKQMSTRKGNVVLLESLLDEAEKRAYELIKGINHNLSDQDIKKMAVISGISAVKYNILSQNRIHNITFVWDQMITLDGNSAPYLQYTFARASSILDKNEDKISTEISLTEKIEIDLIKKICDFPDVLNLAKNEDAPHHLSIYLYELASLFNTFYNSYPVLKAEEKIKNTRLLLVKKISEILEISLNLLTIEAPRKM